MTNNGNGEKQKWFQTQLIHTISIVATIVVATIAAMNYITKPQAELENRVSKIEIQHDAFKESYIKDLKEINEAISEINGELSNLTNYLLQNKAIKKQ